MSAYGYQMEQEYSSQSLSTRGGDSEMGSRYTMESGFHITSFAATILIGSLLTIGVLLITLVIALTVMLQSCESRSSGVIEVQKPNDNYNYCKKFALHAELNNLEADDFPLICRSLDDHYIRESQYVRDLNSTIWVVESYFSKIMPLDGLDVVLIDIDDILPSYSHDNNLLMNRFSLYGCGDCCMEETAYLKHKLILKLCTKLQASGWPLILLSRKPERLQNITIEHLITAGFSDWSSLVMRMDSEMQMDSHEYFSSRRTVILKEGFRIAGVISSQMDALTGPCTGKRVFKLPNPKYYNIDHNIESTSTLK